MLNVLVIRPNGRWRCGGEVSGDTAPGLSVNYGEVLSNILVEEYFNLIFIFIMYEREMIIFPQDPNLFSTHLLLYGSKLSRNVLVSLFNFPSNVRSAANVYYHAANSCLPPTINRVSIEYGR